MPLKGIKAINVVMKWNEANKSAQTFLTVIQWNFLALALAGNQQQRYNRDQAGSVFVLDFFF